ncbi:MAG TPA: ATP-dependent protease ATPase subunit HslU [Thermoanaerobaculaceae bacterium]|nr:ATP-dependent protease ATPase subunit HslU [Thermoanaerobaculaceae bacterium]HPS78092.1 ATP-dependent protease ATPase subunit HslU [Thermoanaerobaculaceae bacterium]
MSQLVLTPREIVAELDRFIIGQPAAKRAVAIALRTRWRRQQLPEELRREVTPANLILIGPTGVGKTEIARRLARLASAPFVKVEASKFTEVGYVGRDVDSIVRDLVEAAIGMVRAERSERVRVAAQRAAEDRLLDLLLPGQPGADHEESRRALRRMLREKQLEEREVEVEVAETRMPSINLFGGQGMETLEMNLRDALGGAFSKRERRRMSVVQARAVLEAEEVERLVDRGEVEREAVSRAQESGIVFLDEIDKIAGRGQTAGGPDVSREGVQRDLLPLVEGTTVTTRYGAVSTDHVLFIAAGAFHVSKPSDLIPELQGRFPVRVQLDALSEADLLRILTEPEHALLKQHRALLATEGVELEVTEEASAELARIAAELNRSGENIGARRLTTVMEQVLEDTSFSASEHRGSRVVLDAAGVRQALAPLLGHEDLARYIL